MHKSRLQIRVGWAPPFNPHWHAIVLEGGFDETGRFVHIPLGNLNRMSEYFRRVIIKFFLKKELISAKLATSLINWRHSGFSVDNSIHLPAHSTKARKALSQYISRRMAVPPPSVLEEDKRRGERRSYGDLLHLRQRVLPGKN